MSGIASGAFLAALAFSAAALATLGQITLGELVAVVGLGQYLQSAAGGAAIADEVFSTLMGDDVESRKGFIQENAKDVRFLDI